MSAVFSGYVSDRTSMILTSRGLNPRLSAHLARLFLSFNEYTGDELEETARLVRLHIKVAVVR